HLMVIKAVVGTVGNSAIIEQRGEHLFYGMLKVIDTDNIEESFLLTGKGGIGKVFCSGGGANGHSEFFITLLELGKGLFQSLVQLGGEWGFDDPVTDLGPRLRQSGHIINVQRIQDRKSV